MRCGWLIGGYRHVCRVQRFEVIRRRRERFDRSPQFNCFVNGWMSLEAYRCLYPPLAPLLPPLRRHRTARVYGLRGCGHA